MISGTEYYRRKARMSLRELSERSGVSDPVLQKLCSGKPPEETPLIMYMRVSEALDVSIGELLKMHSKRELNAGDHTAYPSRTDCMTNCVAVYRREMGLTYAQLAQLLNSPNRECGRQACIGERAGKKHVRLLAAYERISPEEFRRRYTRDKGVV